MAALLALVFGTLTLASAAQAGPASERLAARGAAPTGSFEHHLHSFAGVGDTRVRLSHDGAGRKKTRAMVAWRKAAGPVHAKSKGYAGKRARGTEVSVRTWVRSDTARTVTLQVREKKAGKLLTTRIKRVAVPAKRWTKVKAKVTTKAKNSKLVLHVRTPQVKASEQVLIDDVRVAPTASSSAGRSDARLTNGCALSARGIPSCGTLVGAAHGSNTDPAALEKSLGATLGIRRTYYTATQVTGAVRNAKADLALGRIPWISFKLPHSWPDMVAGKGDAWARDLATRLSALDGPVWIAFHHEPEGDGDIQQWRKMQERLAPLVRAAAPNVAFSVVMTGWNQFYGDAKNSLAQIWPRGVKIDIAGFDVYQQYGVVKNGKTTTKWTDFAASYYAKISTWAKANNVAWGFAETGVTHTAAEARPNEIQNAVTSMASYGGIAYAYFDTTLNSIAPWSLSTATKRAGFARALAAAPSLDR